MARLPHLALGLLLVLPVVAGCLGQTAPEAAPASPAGAGNGTTEAPWRTWNWTGYGGSTTFNGTGWINLAYPIVNGTSLDYNVVARFPSNDADQGFWVCDETSATDVSIAHCSAEQDDGRIEVGLEAGGHRVERSRRSPDGPVGAGPSRYHRVSSTRWHSLDGEPRIARETIAIGGRRPERVTVNISWEDTVVQTTSGPFEETWTVPYEDFNGTASARADLGQVYPWGYAHARTDGRYATELVDDASPRPRTRFWFWPFRAIPVEPGGSIRCPNGEMWSAPLVGGPASTNWTGTWTFGVDESARHSADQAPLMGIRYDRARFPWETPGMYQAINAPERWC